MKLRHKLQLYITIDTYNKLKSISEENGRTVSDLVREGINHIERKHKSVKRPRTKRLNR